MGKLSRLAIVILGTSCLWSSLAYAENQWMISPQAVELQLTRSTVKTFTVANQGTTSLRLAVSSVYYPVGAVGPFARDVALTSQTNKNSLTSYMRVSPAQLVIPPGGSRLVRLAITLPDKKLAEGAYRGYVKFHEIAPQNISVEKISGKEVSADVSVVFDQVAGIYANVGRVNITEASISHCRIALNNDSPQLIFDVKNPTVWKFSPTFTIANTNGKSLAEQLRMVAVMPASAGTREIPLGSITSADQYHLTWSLGKETLGQTLCSRV